MKICFFNAGPRSGLSNNGGSRTIVKSANVLDKMGHTPRIVAKHDSYTWENHPRCLSRVPDDTDVVVAVAAVDVKNALKAGKPTVWWMRGIETWKLCEEKLIERAKMVDKVLVNATHLKGWLAERGVESEVCFAGLDEWKEDRNEIATVGWLKNTFHNSKRYDLCKRMAKEAGGITLELDGTLSDPTSIYRACCIWFAPTEWEGFHNVAAEANLCGCLVVCNRNPHNGMGDYATDETAMRYDRFEEAVEHVKNPDFSRIPRMQQLLKEKIGSRQRCMERFVGCLR